MRGRGLFPGVVVTLALAIGPVPPAGPAELPGESGALWVAESAGALAVSTAEGRLLLEIRDVHNARAVAVDSWRSTVWLWAERSLSAYSFDGAKLHSVPVALPDPSGAALAVHPQDGSVWLAVGEDLRSFSAAGQPLLGIRLPEAVREIALHAGSSLLWVGTSRRAVAYDGVTGGTVRTIDLGGSPDLRDLDVEPATGSVWIALRSGLREIGPDGILRLDIPLDNLLRVAVDPRGGVWAATSKDLVRVSPAGEVLFSLQPFGGRNEIVELVVDPAGGSAWVASHGGIAQVDAGGTPVRSLDVQPPVQIRDLALHTVIVAPEPELPPDPATVAPPLDPTVVPDIAAATEFLYTGADPIQSGVEPGAIDPRRAAVLRGRVLNRDGAPLSGVRVTVLGHPELGGTLTRADGVFDLAVNGGGLLTVQYEKAGRLTAHRTVDTPWRDYLWVDDVVLLSYDPAVTAITSGAPGPQVARGSRSEDADGSRAATLLFPAGTEASMVLPDGSTQPLPILHVRATEYTVGPSGPSAMPAPLPPASGYTYAVELSVDEAVAAGAKKVVFNRPVPFYLENFLGFPVGSHVPTGSYDRDLAAWIPSPDGRVVKVLSVTAGLADLDVTGSGLPSDAAALDALGITEDERRRLAALYPPGQSLWRVPIPHFTPWDHNWPYGPPPDAEEPPDPMDAEGDEEPEDDPCTQSGSVIECENQILGESVPIVGTPFRLHYQSDRTPGWREKDTLQVLLTGERIPDSLRRVELIIDVAGRRFRQSFTPAPDLTYTFLWDRKDAYGRLLQGRHPATIQVGYVYGAVYQSPGELETSFGAFSPDLVATSDRARAEYTFWSIAQRSVGSWDARVAGLGGWTLSVHHAYDPGGQDLLRGDGTRETSRDLNERVSRKIPFFFETVWIDDVSLGPDGSIYILDRHQRLIGFFDDYISWKRPDGRLRISYGAPDVTGMAVGPDGRVYYTVCYEEPYGVLAQLWRLDTDGTRSILLNNLPPQSSPIACPQDVAVEQDGTLLIADSKRLLRLRPDGTLRTVAVAEARRLALGRDGAIYYTEQFKHRVRRIGPDGRTTTLAGTGIEGFTPDGALAAGARVTYPAGIAVAPDGSVLFTEQSLNNGRVRRITPSGVLLTVAGGGALGSSDGALAASQSLFAPNGVALGPDGSVYVSTLDSFARRISSYLPGFENQEIVVAEDDGRSVHLFDRKGRHLSTRDTLTGATLYRFTYGPAGTLATVEDAFGNITRVERDAFGRPTALVGPFGQRTPLALDPNGFLRSIWNPAGEENRFFYDDNGLLTTMIDPRGAAARYTWSEQGRLLKAEDRAGGSKRLERFTGPGRYEVSLTTSLGRETRYGRDELQDGRLLWTTVSPAGLTTATVRAESGEETVTAPSGTVLTYLPGPDPRFGMQAPVPRSVQIRTPSGLTLSATTTREATLSRATDPFSLTTLRETTALNGRTATSVYSASLRRFTFTSPAGRQSTLTIDSLGRPAAYQITGIEPFFFTYDTRGRLASMVQGTAETQRAVQLAYDVDGWLAGITDPLARQAGFAYDDAGRVLRQTLPDAREIGFTYDANGNLASLTPPGRPAHGFGYTPVDLQKEYAPPLLESGATPTAYSYNLDQQLTRVARPDGRSLDLGYDDTGRLSTVVFSAGALEYHYHPVSGRLETLIAPDGETLQQNWDGFLPTVTTWSGTVAGSVTRAYDNDFRLISQKVNGTGEVTFQYDADSLLTRAGSLTLTRDSRNGLVTATTLNQVKTAHTYNTFGEMAGSTATFGSTPLLSLAYTRDNLGRIIRKTETIGGATDVYDYTYDLAGRLTDVLKNGASLSHYDYDANSNRLAHVHPGGTVAATYDAQDRLLTYGDRAYTYTANGELATKTQNGHTVAYAYDEIGNLRSVVLPEGITIAYIIDGQNRCIGKKINGILVQGFLYQDQLEPIAELDRMGAVVARFIYGSRPNVPDTMLKNGRTYRILSDHLGSPRLVVDAATGAVAQRMDYDEFGRVILDTNPGFQPFGFAGGIYDRHTGLVRFGWRDYDAEVGRWVGKDPILFGGEDTNLYVYALGEPVNRVDLLGLAWIWNKSDKPIPYKAEGKDYQLPDLLQPGKFANVDGLYSPPGTENPIALKIPDNCLGIVEPCGKVDLRCFAPDLLQKKPEIVSPENLQDRNFLNWPDPYEGRKWPYEKWPFK